MMIVFSLMGGVCVIRHWGLLPALRGGGELELRVGWM